jgi:hypothetical protein
LAELARQNEDVEGIQTQLDRGPDHWISEAAYAIHEADISFLRGDVEQTKEKLEFLKQHGGARSSNYTIRIALLERDVELALTLFEQAVSDSDPLVIILFVYPAFAQLRAHPRFHDIVRQIGLDDDSLAKLKIPPLPF